MYSLNWLHALPAYTHINTLILAASLRPCILTDLPPAAAAAAADDDDDEPGAGAAYAEAEAGICSM